MTIKYKLNKPTVEEFTALRDSADWNLAERGITLERAKASLEASPLCVCAYEGDKIIGMVRVAGDLEMYGYIQDTIVLPEYRGRGVGRQMMEVLLEQISTKKGYLLGVCPSKVSVEFYENLGFRKRPENPNGFMNLEI